MNKELDITLKHLGYTCRDRYCVDYGTEVLINN